jgi:hypothetical protein
VLTRANELGLRIELEVEVEGEAALVGVRREREHERDEWHRAKGKDLGSANYDWSHPGRRRRVWTST